MIVTGNNKLLSVHLLIIQILSFFFVFLEYTQANFKVFFNKLFTLFWFCLLQNDIS